MRIIYIITIFLFSFFIGNTTAAQDSFERRYPTSTVEIVTSDMITVGNRFAISAVEINQDEERRRISFTRFNNKGTEDGTTRVRFGDTLEIIHIREVGNVVFNDSSRYYSVCGNIEKDSLNKMVVTFDTNGNLIWGTRLGTVDDRLSDAGQEPVLAVLANRDLVHFGHMASPSGTGTDILLSSLDPLTGAIKFQKRLALTNAPNEQIIQAVTGIDSQLMILSTVQGGDEMYLSKMDTLGDIAWTKSYAINDGRALDDKGYDLIQLLDTSWAIIGGIKATTIDRQAAMLLQVDDDGVPLLSEMIRSTSAQYQVYPNGIVGTLDTTVIMSAIRHDMVSDTFVPLVFSYNLDSVIGYQTLLDTAVSADAGLCALGTNDSISAAFLYTTTKSDLQIPNLSKVDGVGQTMCEESANLLRQDTLLITVTDVTYGIADVVPYIDSIPMMSDISSPFSPPLLTLMDTVYCPDDPIMYFQDATVRGGVEYLWDDGSKDSARIFREEGTFSVMVTVREDLCFTLCDTFTISVLGTPSVTITKNLDNVCTQDIITLIAAPEGSVITEYLWSTGETTPTIAVPETPATYSLTVTDVCRLTASASTTISEADLPSASGTFSLGCEGLLTATGSYTSVSWSTGETADAITVTTPGTYTASFLDQCGDVDEMVSIDISADQIPPQDPLTGELTKMISCGSDEVTLAVVGSGFSGVLWSTGQTSEMITVSEAGNYSVTLVGESYLDGTCDDELLLDQSVSAAELLDQGCLKYPTGLEPQSNVEENQTFAPRIVGECNVTNYEMNIFNRWGKKLFTSNSVEVGWNGSGASGSQIQPGGVYYYWVRYTNGDSDCELRGDVTLVR